MTLLTLLRSSSGGGGGGGGAIALAGTPSIYENASATIAAVPYPAGVTAGEVLTLSVTSSNGTVAISTPTGWTLAKSQVTTSDGPGTATFYKLATGSETGTADAATNVAAGRTTGVMARWSGVDTTTPIDVAGVSATSGVASTLTMPSITTTTAGVFLVHHMAINASGSADIDTLSGTTRIANTTGTGRRTGVFHEARATAGATGTRVWSMTPTTPTLQWTGVTIALRPGASGPIAPALVQRVVGIPDTNTSTSARVNVKTTNATSVRIKCSTDSAGTTGVVYGSAATPDSDGNATLTVTGLTANTRYYYRVEMTDSEAATTLDTGAIGRLKTAPTGQASFAFDFGSCTNNTDSDSFAAIAARGDDLFFHLGDLFYADASGTGLANFRDKFNSKITAPNHAAVFSTMNTTYSPSDHDAMNNNGTAGDDPTAWTNWNTVKNELFPMPANYYSFVWGRVRFIQTDTRSYKSPSANTDNSSKTALGTTQKTWLKSQIDNATEPAIVIIQSDPWIIGTDPGDDGWGGYITERDEMANYYSASGKNIVILAGDMHALAAEDGSSAPGGCTVFQAAPFYQNASIKGGPYDVGPYPASGTAVVQQYGRVAVTDNGTSIDFAYTGYSSDNTSRVTLTKNFTVASYDFNGSANFTGSGTVSTTRTLTASGTAAVSGSGTLTNTRIVAFSNSSALSGAGTLSNTRTVATSQSVALSGSGTLSTTSVFSAAGSAAFTGSGTLTGSSSAELTATGTAAFSGAGTLSSTRILTASGSAGLTGAGTLSFNRLVEFTNSSAFSGAGTLTNTRTVSFDRSSTFTGTGTLSASGVATISATGSATFSGAGTLTAIGNIAGNTYNLFTTTPQLAADPDTGSVNLGTEFYVTATAWVTQVRYLQPSSGGTSTSRIATIYSTTDGTTGTAVAGPFTIPASTAGTWSTYTLPTPFELTANTRYRITIRHPDGRYAATGDYFTNGDGDPTVTQGILVVPNNFDALSQIQGSYTYDSNNVFPSSQFGGASYYSDVTVTDSNPSSGLGFSVSVNLSGVGTLSSAQLVTLGQTIELAGSGTVTAATSVIFTASTSLTSAGTLSASGVALATASGSANFSGSGTLSTVRTLTASGSAGLSGTGTLSNQVSSSTSGLAGFSGSGTLSRATTLGFTGLGSYSSTGTLTLSQLVEFARSTNFTGAGTLTGQSNLSTTGVSTLSSTGTLSTTSQITASRAANLTGSGTLTASGSAVQSGSATANFTSTGTLASTSGITTLAAAGLSGSGTLSATNISISQSRAVTFTGSGSLNSQTQGAGSANLDAQATGTLTAVTTVTTSRSVSLSAAGTLTQASTLAFNSNTAQSGSGTLSASRLVAFSKSAGFDTTGTLSSAVTVEFGQPVTFQQNATGTLSVAPVIGVSRTGVFAGAGTLSATNIYGTSSNVALTGAGTLTRATSFDIKQNSSLTASGTLSASNIQVSYTANANFTGIGSLGIQTQGAGASTLNAQATGTLTATAGSSISRSVNLSATGSISTQQVVAFSSTASVSGSGTLSSDPRTAFARNVSLAAAGTMSVANTVNFAKPVALTATGSIAVSNTSNITRTVPRTSSGTLSAVATNVTHAGIANFTSIGSLNTATGSAGSSVYLAAAEGTLSPDTKPGLASTVTLTATAQITVSTTISISRTVTTVATGTLTANGKPEFVRVPQLTVSGVLTTFNISGQNADIQLSAGSALSAETYSSPEQIVEFSSTGLLNAIGSDQNEYGIFASTGLLSVVTSAIIGPRTRETFVITLESKTYNGSIESNKYAGTIHPQSKYSVVLNPAKKVN